MKQLTCEMCGSNNMVKQDGMFVCQDCGTKYSVEEARKLMIEGPVDVTGSTVKIDSSEKLQKLLVLARRAREEDNAEEAEKYYSLALIESPDDWTANFYSSYYKLLSSSVLKLSTNLENFKTRANTTLKMLISNGEDTSEFYSSVSKLYTVVAAHMNQREEELSNEVLRAGLAMLTGGSSVDFDIAKNNMKEELIKLWSYTIEIEKSALDLYSIEKQNGTEENNKGLANLFVICDKAVNIGSKRIIENNNYPMYVQQLTDFAQVACEVIPGFKSEAVADMKERAAGFKEGNWKKGQDIVRMLSDYERQVKRNAEEKEKQRIVAYWNEHSEEKAKLESEKKELLEKISLLNSSCAEQVAAINKEIAVIPGKGEIDNLDTRIKKLSADKAALGIFKGKEKKALQEQIDQAEADKKAVQQKMSAAKAALESKISAIKSEVQGKISPLQSRANSITTELTKAR